MEQYWNDTGRGKRDVLRKKNSHVTAILSTRNPTWAVLGLNLDLRIVVQANQMQT
jgi:hypothetical protein